jgi:hypothetical protein
MYALLYKKYDRAWTKYILSHVELTHESCYVFFRWFVVDS